MRKSEKPYFPALDGLRFIAFLAVFLHHATFYMDGDFSENEVWKFFRYSGWVGVDIFFVLTGFLITILLLHERENFGKFSIKHFWYRRILRIWPLYYLAFMVGFFVAPFMFSTVFSNSGFIAISNQEVDNTAIWYLSFLGNWSVVLQGYGELRSITQLWAISVDQQFYILWPLVLLFVTGIRSSLFIGLLFILGAVAIRFFLTQIGTQHPGIYVHTSARLDSFVIGALLAQMLFYKPTWIDKFKWFYSLMFQVLSIIVLVTLLYFSHQQEHFAIRNGIYGYLVIALIISYLILVCIKTNTFLVKILSSTPFIYLGKISYGLYIWHILALEILFYSIGRTEYQLLIPILGLPLTIFFGYQSYIYIEKPFLNYKSKI